MRRRRSLAAILILSALVGSAGAWALPRIATAAGTWAATPSIEARTVGLAGGIAVTTRAASASSARVAASQAGQSTAAAEGAPPDDLVPVRIEPGARFDMVGVLVDRPVPRQGVVVWLRASEDGLTWGDWFPVDLQPSSRAGSPRGSTEPVWVGPAHVLELAAEGVRPTTLDGVRVMAIDTAGGDSAGDQVVAAARKAVAVVAALVRPSQAEAMTTTPTIVTRAQWGANESWKSGTPDYAPVKMAFVHHTVNANGYTQAQAAGIMRGIYYYDVFGNHWSDFGYNFAIDRFGTIYEGRAGGVTRGVIGAQVLGFNTSSTGIAMIGTFSTVKPPAAMVTALERLLAWKLDVHHVDPAGDASMLCRWTQKYREGQTVTFPAIAGHRQANYTACPGDALYRLLPTVRNVVAATGLPKIYAYRVATSVISPNGDAVKEATRVRFRNSASADWTVRVTDAVKTVVRTLHGTGETVDSSWKGDDDAGRRVPDGVYTVTARASTSGGQARAATATVRVDTVAPAASAVGARPAVFSPNGDGFADKSHVLFTPSEACYARVLVVDGAGAVLRVVSDWHYVRASAQDVMWDGRINGPSGPVPASEGQVLYRIEMKDFGGNRSTAAPKTTLDRTLGFARSDPQVFSPNGDGVKDASSLIFKLSRKADVEVVVSSGAQTVRTLRPGSLAAGSQTVTWDGSRGDGSTTANGLYRWTVTATSAIGTVSVANWVTVDLYRPRLTAPSGVSVTLGKSAKIAFKVSDPYSNTVHVTATVTNASGKVLATIDRGWVTHGVAATVSWKPPARRTYTMKLTARDRAGNPQYAVASTTITVK